MTVAALNPASERPSTAIAVDLPAGFAFLALLALVLNPLFGTRAAWIFLIAGGLLFATNIQHSARSLLRFWYVLLIPAYCALSTFWSEFPAETFRGSLQLAATLAIGIMIATRVPPRILVRSLFIVFFLAIIASAVFGRVRDDTGAWVGIFGSKNAFAGIASIFILTCVAAAAESGAGLLQRGAALLGMALGVPILLLAQSAGAAITIIPSAGAIVLVLAAQRLTPRQRLFAVGLLALGFAVAGALALVNWDAILHLVLNLSNKDATLTGRTDLWEVGDKIIARSPLLGVGYRAFWVQGYAPAEELWAQFGIAARTGFNFHNTYISNAVEIGIVGLVIEIAAALAAVVGTAIWAFRAPTADNGFFAGYLTATVLGSFVEVSVFYPFSLPSLLVVCALVYSFRAVTR